MKILALEHDAPETAREQYRPLLHAEAERIWQLYLGGIIRELYFRADAAQAVLVLECADVETARMALDSLPLVQAGVISFELIPLAPYPGFARLFADTVTRPELA